MLRFTRRLLLRRATRDVTLRRHRRASPGVPRRHPGRKFDDVRLPRAALVVVAPQGPRQAWNELSYPVLDERGTGRMHIPT